MHVVALLVGINQDRFAREVGEDAQLDLGIIGTQQLPALLGQKRLANPARKLGAHGNVLQVWVAAGQAPGGGDRLVEIGVHSAGFSFHQQWQGIHIGALELAEDAVLQHQGHHRMVGFEFFEHGRVGAPTGFGFAGFFAVEPQGVKEQFAQLFGGGEVEVNPRGGPGIGLQLAQGGGQFAGELLEVADVDADAGGFHQGQHRLQGQFHLIEQARQGFAHAFELAPQQASQAPGEVHVHAAVLGRRFDRHHRKRGPLGD